MIEFIRIIWYSTKVKKIPLSFDRYLSYYSSYYRNLNHRLKRLFRKRTYISSQFIDFRPIEFDEVTEEMKILITSALIQMTFGLNKYILRRFKTIYVVPNTYRFQQYEALLGHVDYSANVIVMSWPSVTEGFVIPDDAFNVALHELSHALQAENQERLFYNRFFNAVKLEEFNEAGAQKLYDIRAKRHNYLREYAGINMIEFFAVSVETFFEQPEEFKTQLPKLYKILVNLWRQDPCMSENPLFGRNFK